jgi:hypothetical protein
LPNISQLRARLRVYSNIEPIEGKGLLTRFSASQYARFFRRNAYFAANLCQPRWQTRLKRCKMFTKIISNPYSRNALREAFALTLTLVMMLAALTAVAT